MLAGGVMSFEVLVVDDHESVRRGLRSLLSSSPEWTVCGEAADGIDAIEKAKTLRPDVVLMDVSMPRMDGLEAARVIRRELPQTKVILISQNDPDLVRQQARDVDAAAFVTKGELAALLIPTLNRVLGINESKPGTALEPDLPTPWWLAGGGDLASLIRDHDWSQTPLGPIEHWPHSLKTSVNLILNTRHPMWIGWGTEATFLYNDAYIQVLSLAKHPWALGKPAAEVWREIWDICKPLADKVFRDGEATFIDDIRLFMNRGDFLEEVYYSFSYSPIRDELGTIVGLFCPSTDVTPKVINARRLRTLSELSANALTQKTTESACASAAATLATNTDDIPFALLYLIDRESNRANLEQACGVARGVIGLSPELIDLNAGYSVDCVWPLPAVVQSGQPKTISITKVDGLPLGPAKQALTEAIVLPITSRGDDHPIGVLVAGINPTRRLDTEYRTFYELATGQIATAIENARAAEEEKKRLNALAELDRAKTAFFSNVSHEFRTPLTLMLGPVEELLARSHTDLPPAAKTQLELVNRNGSRLLRLVNTLLDFSRIEAGRMRATYEPTDLSAFTVELVSVFRSATEKAGLRLELDCPKLAHPVYIDRNMWEKIILNLISNAFKFTFEGSISVALSEFPDHAELRVRDTGVGIPPQELPHLFDRFHRVENVRSRTHEGSGIGLALVYELVKLHGGSIRVESAIDKGSTFIVSLPLGSAHLPSERVGGTRTLATTAMGAAPYVEEALRWLPDVEPEVEPEILANDERIPVPCPPTSDGADSVKRPVILIADDNADMRQYLSRLLAEHYQVVAVPDGWAALVAIQNSRPDLILTDVMMPNLDGFGLLRELRSKPETQTIPIIVLSARAGEEARVEGMERGADDYLIKPFSARELLARVQTHLEMARLRKEGEQALREHRERFDLVARASKLGFWFCDLPFDKLIWDNRVKEHFWLPPDAEVTIDTFYERLHPEDRERTRQAIETSIAKDAPYDIEYRTVAPDGRLKWIRAIGRTFRDLAGRPLRFDGVTLDVTDHKRVGETTGLLAAIVTSSQDAIISKDLNGIITSWNGGAERIFGYKSEEVIGKPITLLIPQDRHHEEVDILDRLRRGERIDHFETVRVRKDGALLNIALTISPVRDASGHVIGASKVARDITQQKRAEARERQITAEAIEANAKFRAVFEQTTVFAGIMTKDGVLVDANKMSLDACGYHADDTLGRPFWEAGWWRNHQESRDKIRAAMPLVAQGIPYRETLNYSWGDGTERIVDFALYPIVDADGEILFLHPTGVDVTDIKRTEEKYRQLAETLESEVRARTRELEQRNIEILKQSELLREFSQRLLQVQDEERRRIARELHDSSGQLIAALAINLGKMAEQLKRTHPDLARDTEESEQLVQQLSQDIRTMSYLLHPPLLDEIGLAEALRWYVQGLVERSGLQISLNVAKDFGRLSREMELVLFRLVQECLTNIHRHSGSRTAIIALARKGGIVSLDIRDEGKGIPLDKLNRLQSHSSGVGMRGMNERVRQFGGEMKVESNETGTKISFVLPASDAESSPHDAELEQLPATG
jgi:PAS domain S-box-containing protein